MIQPNQLNYPPPMFSQPGTFVPAVNQMPMITSAGFIPQPNFMQPPPMQQMAGSFAPMSLSSVTPVIPDNLKPLKGGRGQVIMNPQRYVL